MLSTTLDIFKYLLLYRPAQTPVFPPTMSRFLLARVMISPPNNSDNLSADNADDSLADDGGREEIRGVGGSRRPFPLQKAPLVVEEKTSQDESKVDSNAQYFWLM